MSLAPRETYVVLADLVDSRGIENREQFEHKLEETLSELNNLIGERMAVPLTQMKGVDEFGCVLTHLAPLPKLMCGLLDRIFPTLARVGVATGEIDIGTDTETVAQMDGPAFHRASDTLEEVEAHDLYVGVSTGSPVDTLVSGALNALILSRQGLTKRQQEVILTYERHGTQAAAGDELGIHQQAVSQTLRRADYGRRSYIRKEISKAIEKTYE